MKKSFHQIQALCLDVDGTLYDLRRMVWTNLRTIWPVRKLFRQLHEVRDSLRGNDPVTDFRAVQAERLAERLRTTPRQARELIDTLILERWMSVFDRVRPLAGLLETLKEIHQLGIRLAILSDYPIGRKLAGLGLECLPFEVVVNAEDSGTLKPHPHPFQVVAEALAVTPNSILHVGDRNRHDVAGALAAGMHAALLYRGRHRPRTQADFAFRHWRHFLPIARWKGLLR